MCSINAGAISVMTVPLGLHKGFRVCVSNANVVPGETPRKLYVYSWNGRRPSTVGNCTEILASCLIKDFN